MADGQTRSTRFWYVERPATREARWRKAQARQGRCKGEIEPA